MLAGRVNGVTEATDGPDLSTTAGKLADLKPVSYTHLTLPTN